MDGGIRRGTDVLKALALGAKAVLLGRPVLYGLAINGEEGVQQVLETLRREFELAMALSGCKTLQDIGPQLLLQLPAAELRPVAAGYRADCSGSCCSGVPGSLSMIIDCGCSSKSASSDTNRPSAGGSRRCEQISHAPALQRSKL